MVSHCSAVITYTIYKSRSKFNHPWESEQKLETNSKKETVTKIHGQPTNHDLTIREKEIIAILANIPTALGGGNH